MAKVLYRYTSDQGEYFSGIPARDLDEDDVALLTDEQRELVVNGTLYKGTPTQNREDAAAGLVEEKAPAAPAPKPPTRTREQVTPAEG